MIMEIKEEAQTEIKYSSLSLPCLRGAIGDWNFYNVVIPFSELYRIDNHHIIKEAKSLDEWLQRKLTHRSELIKDYLLNEDERYFNSIIVGVYGDMPDWYALSLNKIAQQHNLNLGDQVENSLGILGLTGKEILFTIDGQHRIEGIKSALMRNRDRFINDELSVTFIAHNNNKEGIVRTRKLFATINRESKTPTPNDLAIIDEVYAYNIIARDLYSKYEPFRKNIALTENRNIDRKDQVNFTNLLSLVEINKKILKLVKYKQSKYNGPTLSERDKLYTAAVRFWDYCINNITDYSNYFNGNKPLSEYRNAEKGKPLNLLYLPIGMKLLADIYVHFAKQNKLENLDQKINKINFSLYGGNFATLYFDEIKNTIKLNNQTVAKDFFLYLLGEGIDMDSLKLSLAKAYGINELSDQFKDFTLPSPI